MQVGLGLGIPALRRVPFGEELVTNGKFTTDTTGWTAVVTGASIASVGGELEVTAANGQVLGGARQSATSPSGVTVRAFWDVTSFSDAGWRIQIGDSVAANTYYDSGTQTGTGTFTQDVSSADTTLRITLYAVSAGTGAQTATFDNVSAREVL